MAEAPVVPPELISRLRQFTVNTAVHLSCYGNEKRRPCYRLVTLVCLASFLALVVLATKQEASASQEILTSRRNLLLLEQQTEKIPTFERPKIRTSRLVKPFNFKITDEPVNSFRSCKDTYLLIVVCSSPGHREKRNAIRETWGSEKALAQYKVAVVFALGSDVSTERDVAREIEYHGDVLRGTFLDTYLNLTLKSTMTLKYVSAACENRGGPSFLMKTDDDIFVNVPLLVSALKRDYPTPKRVITGCIKQKNAPKAIHPYGLTPPSAWPMFTAGAGYVISGDLVPSLYMAARRIAKPSKMEDVFVTGQCARRVPGAHPPHHEPRFSCGGAVPDDCRLVTQFTGHHISPSRQHLIWDKFSSDPNPCMDF